MAKTATIASRGARVAVRAQAFVAEVLRTRALSPSMMRVVLGGRGLLGFVSTGVGDEFVRLLFAAVGESEPRLPEAKDGVLDYGSIDPDLSRVYTVRRFDAERGEVTIDFALHSGGIAAAWAVRAKPGDRVGITSPTPLHAPPDDRRVRRAAHRAGSVTSASSDASDAEKSMSEPSTSADPVPGAGAG